MSIEPETEILLNKYLPLVSIKKGARVECTIRFTSNKIIFKSVFYQVVILVDGCKVYRLDNEELEGRLIKWLNSVGIEKTDLTVSTLVDFVIKEFDCEQEIKIFIK